MHLTVKWTTCLFLGLTLQLSSCTTIYKTPDFIPNHIQTRDLNPELLTRKHPCDRPCVKGAKPMKCYFHFTVEWFHTLAKSCYGCPFNVTDCTRPHCVPGGGVSRPIITINRQMPGPRIAVCQHDRIVVDVENQLMHDATSIHWHGLHQHETPYSDGVPMLTQCHIEPLTTFRYDMFAQIPGTHFWHSHVGVQRGDGAFGSLIVRVPPEDNLVKHLYDYDLNEHVMLLQDWDQVVSLVKFAAYHLSNGDQNPPFLLVNGLGSSRIVTDAANNTAATPYGRYIVKQGFRYRFRVINAGFANCPIEMNVDNHTMKIIATDGNPIKPIDAQSLVVYAGERYDFVITATEPSGLYWFRFRGLMLCASRQAHQAAVLQYEGESDTDLPQLPLSYALAIKPGLEINTANLPSSTNTSILIADVQSFAEIDDSLKGTPDLKYIVAYDFFERDNPVVHYPLIYGFTNVSRAFQRRSPQLNYITNKFPSFPLLTQRNQITPDMLCNETNLKNCDTNFCACTHVVNLKLNDLVELILVDKGFAIDTSHPFHLHGFNFYVVAQHKVGRFVTVEEVLDLEEKGLVKRNLVDPVLKDVVAVPDGGFSVLRFRAYNPGYWLMHCHIDFHSDLGMSIIFKVGEHEDMVPTPKHFPKCGNYLGEPYKPTTGKPCVKPKPTKPTKKPYKET